MHTDFSIFWYSSFSSLLWLEWFVISFNAADVIGAGRIAAIVADASLEE